MNMNTELITIDGKEYVFVKRQEKQQKAKRQISVQVTPCQYLAIERSGFRGLFLVSNYAHRTNGEIDSSSELKLKKYIGEEKNVRIFISVYGKSHDDSKKVDVCLKSWKPYFSEETGKMIAIEIDYPIFPKQQTAATAA